MIQKLSSHKRFHSQLSISGKNNFVEKLLSRHYFFKKRQFLTFYRSASNIETIIELKFEKAKRRQQGRGITTISRAKMAAQAALGKHLEFKISRLEIDDLWDKF